MERKWKARGCHVLIMRRNAYHALATDERRKSFAPALWEIKKGRRNTAQTWFPGVHSDVGGGYEETGLSNIALSWMIEKAGKCGLDFNKKYLKSILAPDPLGEMHDSYSFKFGRAKARIIPQKKDSPDTTIHSSVRERWDKIEEYWPVPLQK